MRTKLILTCMIAAAMILLGGCKKETVSTNLKSATYTVYYSNWTWHSGDAILYQDINWSEITQDIVDKGTVLVYLKTSSGWAPLPRTIMLSGTLVDYAQSQRYTYDTGRLRLVVQDDDRTEPNSFSDWEIKVVAVTGSQRMANPNLDWNDYEAVKTKLNLTPYQ